MVESVMNRIKMNDVATKVLVGAVTLRGLVRL